MGSPFSGGGVKSTFTGAPQQQRLLKPLANLFLGSVDQAGAQYGGIQQLLAELLPQLQRDTSGESKALAERTFQEALLQPSLRAFNRDIAPGIREGFAGIGGTLSSRRGQAISRGLTDVHLGAQASLAQMLPQIQAFPLQQTLSQIGGLGALQQSAMGPIQQALQFALSSTQNVQQEPPGMGWSLLGDLIGAGGKALGAKMLPRG